MKIEHFYYFLIVAGDKSINKAAQRLYISQQQLSRIIQNIEESVQTKLLDRTTSGVNLTKDGEIFFRYAKKIVDDYREMEAFFYMNSLPKVHTDRNISGKCKVTFPFFFSLFLNDFISKLGEEYPNIKMNYEESQGSYSTDEIYRSDRLYLYVDLPEHEKNLRKNKLVSYPIAKTYSMVCVNKKIPLARKRLITREDLTRCPVTTYPCEDWNIFGGANVIFSSFNIHQHLFSVEYNESAFLVPAYIKKGVYDNYSNIVMIPFENQISYPIYIMHSKKHELSDIDKVVIRFFSTYFHDLNNELTPGKEPEDSIK